MCGITGFWDPRLREQDSLKPMIEAIRHRGPDDTGSWANREVGIHLGHTRLSIIDLTQAGHQPMKSHSGRFVLVYNGETYNYTELRDELEKSAGIIDWRGHSDTETLLAGFDHWGIQQTITKTIGMFAFALWDKETRLLTIGRDRLGEKPLYYGWQNGVFLFGSELSALRAHPLFQPEINRNSITLLMRHNCIPAPYSIYNGIKKLPAGCLLTIDPDNQDAEPVMYWDAKTMIARSIDNPFGGSPEEAVSTLDNLLKDAVARQMISDVPLGAFLSGGVDSSTVAALMQASSDKPIRTFSMGFDVAEFNEAEHAKAVAKHLGTEHTELYVSSKAARDVIPRLPTMYSEPFSDSSQIPTFLVSQMAKEHVTVSLSGDGGDELFCGYNRYVLSAQTWDRLSRLPVGLRSTMANFLTSISPDTWNKTLGPIQRFMPSSMAQQNIGEKLHKAAGVMPLNNMSEVYRHLVSHWQEPSKLVLGTNEPSTILTDSNSLLQNGSQVEQMMALDLLTYLPNDILCKVDRAAMSVALETRVPMLDHRVVEFAWQLPLDYKLRNGVGKWVLREVLYKYVPKSMIERPKMGFGIPIGDWLRGPLKEWAYDLLSPERLKREGFFDSEMVQEKWQQHMSGKFNWQYHLWDILMFQSWLEENGN